MNKHFRRDFDKARHESIALVTEKVDAYINKALLNRKTLVDKISALLMVASTPMKTDSAEALFKGLARKQKISTALFTASLRIAALEKMAALLAAKPEDLTQFKIIDQQKLLAAIRQTAEELSTFRENDLINPVILEKLIERYKNATAKLLRVSLIVGCVLGVTAMGHHWAAAGVMAVILAGVLIAALYEMIQWRAAHNVKTNTADEIQMENLEVADSSQPLLQVNNTNWTEQSFFALKDNLGSKDNDLTYTAYDQEIEQKAREAAAAAY